MKDSSETKHITHTSGKTSLYSKLTSLPR